MRGPLETLGAVALHIANTVKDPEGCQSAYRYTPAQVIEVVCNKGRSVASRGTRLPSWLWVRPYYDDGELSLDVDTGNMPYMVDVYIPPDTDPLRAAQKRGRSYRINPPAYELSEGLGMATFAPGLGEYGSFTPDDLATWMLVNGIGMGQRYLVEADYSASCDWETGESDTSFDVGIIYVEPEAYPLCLPLVGGPMPNQTKGWRVQE